MSRTSTGKPEFRLRFGYPYITIDSPGATPRQVALDRGDPVEALRGLAVEIDQAGGRLTAILPETEVWRDAAGGSDSRARAAAELGAPPAALTLVHGRAARRGARPAAAVRRETLAQATAFLARAGLKPVRIIADGPFPGFDAAPDFCRPARGSRDAAFHIRRAAGALALAASVALLLWLAPWSPRTPGIPATVAFVPPPEVDAAAPAPEIALARVGPTPVARPANLAPLRAARPERPPPAPVLIKLAARNLPADIAGPRSSLAPTLGAVPPPLPRPDAAGARVGRPSADTAAGPLPRPTASQPPRSAGLRTGGPRPRPQRPLASVATIVATVGPAIEAAAPATRPAPSALAVGGPRPRPAASAEPVRVAALDPAQVAVASFAPLPPRRQPPAPQIAAARPSVPAPQPQAAMAPPSFDARPSRAQPATTQAQPARARSAAPPVVRVQPQPAQTQRSLRPVAPTRARAAAAQPVRVATAAAPESARSRQAARAQRQLPAAARGPSLRRDSFALVGIFGGAEGRHALVQLPNGVTKRVRAGDDLRGVEVTAIAADAVHLRARGRDSVLTLPD